MDLEDCAICGLSLNDKFPYKLPCNHVFHYECLMKTFDNSNRNRCPYCREKACYLPLVNGVKKIKPGVHCEDIQTQHILEKNHVNTTCEYVFVKGKNKGAKCGKHCKLGYTVCGSHWKG